MKKIILISTLVNLLIFGNPSAYSQSVGISGTGSIPDISALLDIDGTGMSPQKGLLIPRVVLTSLTDVTTIATPATSLLIYNPGPTVTPIGYYYNSGTTVAAVWVRLLSSLGTTGGWGTLGNAGTVDGTNFLGTTDNIALSFRVNNLKALKIDPSGPTFLGFQAGNVNTATNNTGVGYQALFTNISGDYNTANGYQALYTNTGNDNTATGYYALYSNANGTMNTANGMYSLYSNSSGSENTATGTFALELNTKGSWNTANGTNSLYNNTTAKQNTAIGANALFSQNYSNTATAWNSDNVAVGYSALYSNQPTAISNGIKNTAVGNYALLNNTIGYYNTTMGDSSLYSNTTATQNTALGNSALFSQSFSNTSAIYPTDNIAIGYKALYYNQPSSSGSSIQNTAIGNYALYNNKGGVQNVAIGHQALYFNTTGSNNTANGFQALYATTSSDNTAIGAMALNLNTTGYRNTANGFSALYINTTGYQNVANGWYALYMNRTAGNNTAIGTNALSSQSFLNGGIGYSSDNVAVGYKALYSNQPSSTADGIQNTAVGNYALQANTTGLNNTAVGYNAFTTGTAYSNSMALGANTVAISATSQVHIGSATVGTIAGQVGWGTYSDARIKNNIQENVQGLAFIKELRPVTYHYDIKKENEITGSKDTATWEGKYDIEKLQFSGFIAQEVEAAAKKINYSFSGVDKPKNENGLYSLRYAEFVVPLVKGMQEQQEEIINYKLQITNLEIANKSQQSAILKLETANNKQETSNTKQETRIKKLEDQLGILIKK